MEEFLLHVDTWLSHKNRSIPMLAKISSVSQPTIRRALSRESKITIGNALKILKVTEPDNERFIALVKGTFPEHSIYEAPDAKSLNSDSDAGVTAFLDNPLAFQIYVYCLDCEGVSRNSVIDYFGKVCELTLTNLILNGAVEERGDRLVSKNTYLKDRDLISIAAKHNCDMQINNEAIRKRQYTLYGNISEKQLSELASSIDALVADFRSNIKPADPEEEPFILNINLSQLKGGNK